MMNNDIFKYKKSEQERPRVIAHSLRYQQSIGL